MMLTINEQPTVRQAGGVKYDAGKTQTGLLLDFSHALNAVAEVGTFGAKKYSRGGWMSVENANERYTDAMMRHLLADGNDEESGLPHLAHMVWNALALLEMEYRYKADRMSRSTA
jgi:hypothetical protein